MTMTAPRYTDESPAVLAHLTLIQGLIDRMAGNCSASKTWAVTLVSAMLVVAVEAKAPAVALLAAVPAMLFAMLDCYYLGLETVFRTAYNDFVLKVHQGMVGPVDLYAIDVQGGTPPQAWRVLSSPAIWPFYTALVLAVVGVALTLGVLGW